MKKLTLADIRGPKLYEGFRDDLRKRVIAVKKLRRIALGPIVTLLFENRTTMIFQIEEMCRAEKLETPDKIQGEIDVYNAILPDEGELAATLFIEINDDAKLRQTLDDLVGLQDHVWLEIGDARIPATFDPEQFASDKFAAVQYLRFVVPEAARAELGRAGGRIVLRSSHPRYHYEAALSEESRAEIAKDLQ